MEQTQFSSSSKRSWNHLTDGSESCSKPQGPEVVFRFFFFFNHGILDKRSQDERFQI